MQPTTGTYPTIASEQGQEFVPDTSGQRGYLDLTRLAFSLVTLFYFVAVIAINQSQSIIFTGFFYLTFILAAVVFFMTKRAFTLRRMMFYAFGGAVLGLINLVFIGNLPWLNIVIMVFSFLMAVVMLDDAVDERVFLLAYYLNAAVVTLRILQNGRSMRVYVDSSNNYVSIHLLMPAMLYYSMLEARGKKIPIFPAVIGWGLSLLAGGRGGLIAWTILLGGIILHRYLENEASRRERVLLGIGLVVLMIPVLLILVQTFVSRFSDLYVVTRFLDKGMDGGGRLACWTEYIQKSFTHVSWFLFGTPLKEVEWAVTYDGNLHNSYLFEHAYMGIVGFVFVLGLFVRAIWVGIREKKWIYVWCILSLGFRGLTDRVFGMTRLTVVIVTMLFLPDILGYAKKKLQPHSIKEIYENANTCSDSGQSRIQGDSQ